MAPALVYCIAHGECMRPSHQPWCTHAPVTPALLRRACAALAHGAGMQRVTPGHAPCSACPRVATACPTPQLATCARVRHQLGSAAAGPAARPSAGQILLQHRRHRSAATQAGAGGGLIEYVSPPRGKSAVCHQKGQQKGEAAALPAPTRLASGPRHGGCPGRDLPYRRGTVWCPGRWGGCIWGGVYIQPLVLVLVQGARAQRAHGQSRAGQGAEAGAGGGQLGAARHPQPAAALRGGWGAGKVACAAQTARIARQAGQGGGGVRAHVKRCSIASKPPPS